MTSLSVFLDARKASDYGIGRYITGLSTALVRTGCCELTLLTREGEAAPLPAEAAWIINNSPGYSISELFTITSRIRRTGARILHFPHYVVPFFLDRPAVVTIHDLMHLTRPEHAAPHKRAYAAVMAGRAVAEAARIITVSEASRQELIAFFPRAAGKTIVIPNGVGDEFLAEIDPMLRAEIRQTIGKNVPFILWAGNDKPHKNLPRLVAAFSRLVTRGLPHHLVLAGTSSRDSEMRRQIFKTHGIEDRVKDIGYVAAHLLPALFSEAEALVLPSLAEGFGITVLEAQAVGTPVACSHHGGIPEAGGSAALYFDPLSVCEMAEAIACVLSDPFLRERLRKEGQLRARQFTWGHVASKTLEVYHSAVDGEDV